VDLAQTFALVLDSSRILSAQRLPPDPWQRQLLWSQDQFHLLNCSRQSGKSTTVAALALHQALIESRSLVLLVAPAERQSKELFRKVRLANRALGRPLPSRIANQNELELANGSRVVALPGVEKTIRSYSRVRLLVLDEAARVPDDLYSAVRPMLAVSGGRMVALSTPFGQRGWFYEEWQGGGPWKRTCVTWKECPRIGPEFIAEEARALGQGWVDQEYNCLFTALAGLVYPEFEQALVPAQELPPGDKVGGLDFGWRNPFAAIWGVHDRDDVLWIGHERYLRETPISEHAAALPRDVMWYADPAGRTEIEELRRADRKVRRGHNELRPGIAAVTARIRTGRLKVLPSCPNLLAEARLYRYPSAAERAERTELGENPIDANNHALAALRYLVSRLERGRGPRDPDAAVDERSSRSSSEDQDRFWQD
jgi:hypothetical protein